MAVTVAVLASLATTGCEDSMDWFLDVAGAAGDASGTSNTSLASNGSGGYTGTVNHGDGTMLGTYGDTHSQFNVAAKPGTSGGNGNSLLSHGPVLSSPTYQQPTGYQSGPAYTGYQGGGGSPVQVNLAPRQVYQPTSRGGSYPRMSGGPMYTNPPVQSGTSATTYAPSPEPFSHVMAAAPSSGTNVVPGAAAQPMVEANPYATGPAGDDPFATSPPASGTTGGEVIDQGLDQGGAMAPLSSPMSLDASDSFGSTGQTYDPNRSVAGLGGPGANGGMGLGTGGDMMGVGDFGADMLGGGGGGGGGGLGGMGGGLDVSTLS